MRKIIRGVINSKKYTLAEIGLEGVKVKRIYTILDENAMFTLFNPETGEKLPENREDLENLNLRHWITVFNEDKMHDWFIYKYIFKFGAHSSLPGDIVDILVEYDKE